MIYVELLAVLFIAVIPKFVFLFMPEQRRKRTVTPVMNLLWGAAYYIGTFFLILYIALQQESGLLSIGVDADRLDLILAGVILSSFFIIIYAFVQKVLLRVKETTHEKEPEEWIFASQAIQQRITVLITVSLAAVSEELVFRGYFILIWGNRTGYPMICAVISSVIFIILHLNRGKKAIPYYIAVTVLFAIPPLYAGTILVSIGMHLYLNIAVTLGAWIRAGKRLKSSRAQSQDTIPIAAFSIPKPAPNSKAAIALFICSWLTLPLSLFLFAVPAIAIILLAILETIRIRKKKGEIVGVGFCLGAMAVSTLPILAFAAFFLLPHVIDGIFTLILGCVVL